MKSRIIAAVLVMALAPPSVILAVPNYIEQMDSLNKVGQMPPFELKGLDGREIRSAALVGNKVVLMAFWSMYCKACVEKFGALVQIRSKYTPDLLEVVSVNTDAEYGISAGVVREFLAGLETREKYKVNFPVIFDGGDALARKLGIAFLPVIIAVSKEGKIVGTYRRFSEDSEEEMLRGIESIIPEEGRVPPP